MNFTNVTKKEADILIGNYKVSDDTIKRSLFSDDIADHYHPEGMYSCSFETPKYWDDWTTIFHLLFPIGTKFPEMYKPGEPRYKDRVVVHFGVDLSDISFPKRADILCYKSRIKDVHGKVIEDPDARYYLLSEDLRTDVLFGNSYPNGYYPWACSPNC